MARAIAQAHERGVTRFQKGIERLTRQRRLLLGQSNPSDVVAPSPTAEEGILRHKRRGSQRGPDLRPEVTVAGAYAELLVR